VLGLIPRNEGITSLRSINFHVKGENLLGARGRQRLHSKHLWRRFESGASRPPRVRLVWAASALDVVDAIRQDRKQFGSPLIAFPRVCFKACHGWAVEIMVARQLTYFQRREKDEGSPLVIWSRMAKLLGARVAWAAADNGLQIHGGNGFAAGIQNQPHSTCDARSSISLKVPAEIQAQGYRASSC